MSRLFGDLHCSPLWRLLPAAATLGAQSVLATSFPAREIGVSAHFGDLLPAATLVFSLLRAQDLSGYGVHRNLDNCAEVHRNDKRWEVNLDERRCTCRAWQVKGVPCVHAAAFIATRRNAKWEDYVDSHFTVDRFKAAYALGIAPMPSKHEWTNHDLGFKLLPPIMKRPIGRPRKRRIKASDATRKKRSNKCSRYGLPGHHKNTCKNAVALEEHEGASQVTQESTNIQAFARRRRNVVFKGLNCNI